MKGAEERMHDREQPTGAWWDSLKVLGSGLVCVSWLLFQTCTANQRSCERIKQVFRLLCACVWQAEEYIGVGQQRHSSKLIGPWSVAFPCPSPIQNISLDHNKADPPVWMINPRIATGDKQQVGTAQGCVSPGVVPANRPRVGKGSGIPPALLETAPYVRHGSAWFRMVLHGSTWF